MKQNTALSKQKKLLKKSGKPSMMMVSILPMILIAASVTGCSSSPAITLETSALSCETIPRIDFRIDESEACSGDEGTSDFQNSCDTPETVAELIAFDEFMNEYCPQSGPIDLLARVG